MKISTDFPPLDRRLPPHWYKDARPTVAALLIEDNSILVVNNENAAPTQWVPPQGGIEGGKHASRQESILGAFVREMGEELPTVELRLPSITQLFHCVHTIPGKQRECWPDKHMFWLACFVTATEWHDGDPGLPYRRVASASELAGHAAHMSNGKRAMVEEAVRHARRLGYLSWQPLSERQAA